jgi:hypothetical protein
MPVRWTPAKETRFRLRLTEQGRALQWLPVSFEGAKGDLLARLPSLASSAEIKRSQPLTVILATATSPHSGKEVPVISYQQYGEGRVVVIEGAGMWRWAFLPAQFQQKEDIYSALWQSLLRWLVSNTPLVTGQDVALKPTKVTFNSNESASATLLVRDELTGDVPSVQLSSKHLKEPVTYSPAPIGQTPGTYRIVFGKLPEGRYDARVIGHEDKDAAKAVFDVRSLGEEQLNLAARPDLMSRIASDSGGKLLDEETFDEIVKTVAREAGQERVLGVRLTTAWDRKWIMLLALSVWVASWATRRISGLI